MSQWRWVLQFLMTIALSTYIDNTVLKTAVLLIFWMVTFYPLQLREVAFFVIANIVFTISNYGALANSTFTFTHQDIWLMPYNELFMWGFYCLNAQRLIFFKIDSQIKNIQIIKILAYSIIFAATFSVIRTELLLATTLLFILIIALTQFYTRRDFAYISYFVFMGIVVEATGLKFGLWYYPRAEYFTAPLWAPLMWANIGLIISQITFWLLKRRSY